MFHPFTAVLAVPLVVFCSAYVASSEPVETGFSLESERTVKTRDNDEICYQTYTCTTMGPGATELSFEDDSLVLFSFRHSQYLDGSGVNESSLHGDISAGNLSRTIRNGTDDLFTTYAVVRLSENTTCKCLKCSTRFNNDINSFGNATLTRIPQPPSNITVNQTLNKITFAWNPATNLCSSVEDYDVSTSNCGNCSTSVNGATCLNPIEGQNCSITIKTRTQCAVSEPVTRYVLVIGTSPNAMTMSNLGEIIGGALGGTIGAIVVVMLIIGIIVLILCLKRRFSGNKTEVHHNQTNGAGNNNNKTQDDEAPLTEQTTGFGAGEATRNQPEMVISTDDEAGGTKLNPIPPPKEQTDVGAGDVTRSQPDETISLTVISTDDEAGGTKLNPIPPPKEQTTGFGAGEATRDQPEMEQTDVGAGDVTRSQPDETISLTVISTDDEAGGTKLNPIPPPKENDPTVQNFAINMESSTISGDSSKVTCTTVELSAQRVTEATTAVGVKGNGHPIPYPVPASEDSGLSFNERLTKVEQQGDKHEKEMKSMKLQHKEDMKSVELKVQRLQDEIQALRMEREELQKMHKVDTAKIEQLNAKIHDLEQQVAATKEKEKKIRDLEQQVAATKEKLERKKSPRRIKSCGDY